MDEDLKCLLCHLMLDRPLQLTTCNRLVCMACCIGHTYRCNDLRCSCGGAHTIDRSSVISAPAVVQKMLRNISFPCERCQQAVPAGMCIQNNIFTSNLLLVGFKEHTCAKPRAQYLDELLTTPIDTPLTRQEDKLATTLVRRKLAQGSAQDGLVHFRTGGQVLLQKTTITIQLL